MNESLVAFWVYYYPQPWFRAPPYLVGIFIGWLLHDSRDRLVCLPKVNRQLRRNKIEN